MFTGSHNLSVLDQASRILAEAKSFDDIKAIRDKAEAARAYVKAAKLGLELQNRAAEVKLRAERKAGQFLASLKLRGGDRKSNRHHAGLKLDELGVSSDQSRRWQRVASIAQNDFEQYLKTTNNQNREVSSAGLLRLARKAQQVPQSVHTRPIVLRGPSRDSDSHEMLDELMNHCQLLENLLRPIYKPGAIELKNAERRVVARLFAEMNELISQLHRHWPRTSDPPEH